MKLAISGKGGVGKSTLAAMFALKLAKQGNQVLAVDADPDANLASALGIGLEAQKAIVPIAKLKALIEERTGAKVKQYGQMFKLNPEVSDVAEKHAFSHRGVALLVLGAVETGGSGCACPESVLLRSLVTDLVLRKDQSLILDMEAGIEHLGRATAKGVDTMIVVVEPGQRSIDCALRVREMSEKIGIGSVKAIANKVVSDDDDAFIRQSLEGIDLLGSIPFSPALLAADRDGKSVLDVPDQKVMDLFDRLLEKLEESH